MQKFFLLFTFALVALNSYAVRPQTQKLNQKVNAMPALSQTKDQQAAELKYQQNKKALETDREQVQQEYEPTKKALEETIAQKFQKLEQNKQEWLEKLRKEKQEFDTLVQEIYESRKKLLKKFYHMPSEYFKPDAQRLVSRYLPLLLTKMQGLINKLTDMFKEHSKLHSDDPFFEKKIREFKILYNMFLKKIETTKSYYASDELKVLTRCNIYCAAFYKNIHQRAIKYLMYSLPEHIKKYHKKIAGIKTRQNQLNKNYQDLLIKDNTSTKNND